MYRNQLPGEPPDREPPPRQKSRDGAPSSEILLDADGLGHPPVTIQRPSGALQLPCRGDVSLPPELFSVRYFDLVLREQLIFVKFPYHFPVRNVDTVCKELLLQSIREWRRP